MCRLFGLSAGAPVKATFWLLDAPDSLERQSRRNVDGTGIGYFEPDGAPILDKQPEPAYRDPEFTHEAKAARSRTFVAHVRLATAGGRDVRNTHPFAMHGWIMAHNGGFQDVARLDAKLGAYAGLVYGDTDSERFFALIVQQVDAHRGDMAAGIAAAARWIAANLPLTSLNTIIAGPDELWALRYPGQHALHILERPAASSDLHVRSTISTVHAPGQVAQVVVASEELDGETGWRMLAPGELVHVTPDLVVHSELAVPDPPRHLVPLPPRNPNIDT